MYSESERAIHDFLVTLFGDNEGQVYAPTKGSTAKSWVRHFFSWPAQKDEVVNHMVEANRVEKDVYIAPALFKTNVDATKDNWLGTQHIAVDFDGNAPQSEVDIPAGVPAPTLKIQSSVPGREHWYWKLDQFYSGKENRRAIEQIAKSLAYVFDADKSGWDASQVLRAPGTKHRTRGVTAHVLFTESSRVYRLHSFIEVPDAPTKDVRIKIEENQLPDILQVLSEVNLSQTAQEIFNRSKEEMSEAQSRSTALFAFAMECLESRIPGINTLSMLNHLCYKWGKFEDRDDRFIQVKQVLQRAKGKHELKKVDEPVNEQFIDYRFMTIDESIEQQHKPFNWIYDRFLVQGSLNVIASLGGVGKTSLMMQMGMCAATGAKFLDHPFKLEDRIKSVLFSFEMSDHYLNQYIGNLLSHFTEEEQIAQIKANWHKAGMGYPVPLYEKKIQEFMAEQIDLFGSEVIVIDSVKYAGGMDEKHADAFFGWIKRELITKRGLTVYLIHHIRKPASETKDKEPKGLEDLYGDTYIGNIADTVNFLYKVPGLETIRIRNVKARSPIFETHSLLRTNNQWYESLDGTDSPVAPASEESKSGIPSPFE